MFISSNHRLFIRSLTYRVLKGVHTSSIIMTLCVTVQKYTVTVLIQDDEGGLFKEKHKKTH